MTAMPRTPPSAAPSAAHRGHTVLVVDADPVSRRFVELALGTRGKLTVESVSEAAGALELLRTQVVDLVIADTVLPDANGIAFHRRLGQEQRLRDVPFLFLSADARPNTKVVALRAGADDYLTKPCDPGELVARVEAHLGRRARQRERMRSRTYVLAGDLSAMSFPDLVGIIEMSRRTGVVSIVSPTVVGEVYFDEGRVVHARCANLAGEDAFYAFVADLDGHFEFAPGLPDDCPRTIHAGTTALIMEGARRFDDARRTLSANDAEPSAISVRHGTEAPPSSVAAVVPAPVATPSLVSSVEHALRDGFTLAELRLWTGEELARWTRTEGARDRVHVHLLADLAAGVSAMLPLAAAPTERWVVGGLSPEAKAFGLAFFLRQERMLDVVLLDIRDPTSFSRALQRTPAVTIVAAPGGDLMSIGTRGRVALEAYLRAASPPALVGVGNAGLHRDLSRLPVDGAELRCARGVLGEDATDLRELLLVGIAAWARASGGAAR